MSQQRDETEPEKQPYRAPALKTYGDAKSVTLTSLTQNMNDPTNSAQTMT